MNVIDLEKATVSLLDENIIHIHIKTAREIELSDAVYIVEAMGKLGNGKKYPILIDAGSFSSVDKEARIFSAAAESNIYTMADALAYCNLAQKLLADFYIKYNKPVIPTRSFSDKEEAIAWLKTFVPRKQPGYN
jgi:hypothetical protein